MNELDIIEKLKNYVDEAVRAKGREFEDEARAKLRQLDDDVHAKGRRLDDLAHKVVNEIGDSGSETRGKLRRIDDDHREMWVPFVAVLSVVAAVSFAAGRYL